VTSIALASDATNGPLIGYLNTSGAYNAEEGSLSASWNPEQSSGVTAIALAPNSGS
jgi:hypothetical protein